MCVLQWIDSLMVRPVRAGVVPGIAIVLCMLPGTSVARPLPPGSFLRRPAPGAGALQHALRTDPVVAQRYMRTFQVSAQELRATFAQLRLIRLPQDRVFRVHYVHRGEVIGYRVRRVRRGTPVYALRDGTPVLVQVCGNPLQVALPVPEMLLPPLQRLSILDFTPDEPLPPLQSSGLTLAVGPLRTALPPLQLAVLSEPEAPVEPEGACDPGSGLPVVPPALVTALAPGGIALWPATLLSGLVPFLFGRGAPLPGNDFVALPDRQAPDLIGIGVGPGAAASGGTASDNPVRDWAHGVAQGDGSGIAADTPAGPAGGSGGAGGSGPGGVGPGPGGWVLLPGGGGISLDGNPRGGVHVVPEPALITMVLGGLACTGWLLARVGRYRKSAGGQHPSLRFR
ncbi:MAG: hypothetical protein RMJ43_13535 [Chloroherpetonaceae bacterium]|nr:hypothetical protein [Chthonomonadaceae bacterium]MDW8208851.1 hypothetical protein [Chloroherpetonaceae bacterium]